MDVTQTGIKINQNISSGSEKSRTGNQTDTATVPFDQLLAMFNLIGQMPSFRMQSKETSIQNGSEGTYRYINSPINFDFVQGSINLNQEMKDLFQMVNGVDQTTTTDPSQIRQGLVQLFNEIRSMNNQKEFDLTDDLKSKIQLVVESLKTDHIPDSELTTKQESPENTFLFEEGKEIKNRISLDKNQIIIPFVPNMEDGFRLGSKMMRGLFSEKTEDLTKNNEITFAGNQPIQLHDGRDLSKTISSQPVLPVNEFAAEVSEWIGRNIRFSNGQHGSSEAKFSLYPEHLGPIEIKISSQQGQVSAQIITETPLAKEALESQLLQLRHSLQTNGMIVQKLDIVQQPLAMDTNAANLSFSQGGSSFANEQRSFNILKDESKKQSDADIKDFEKEALSISYGGGTPNSASRIDFMV